MPPALIQLLEKILRAGSKYGKQILSAIIAIIIGWTGGKKRGRKKQRKIDDEHYSEIIESLSEKQQLEIADIIQKFSNNENELKKRINDYLKSQGINPIDFKE